MKPLNYIEPLIKGTLVLLMAAMLNGCSRQKSIDYLGQASPGLKAELFAPGIISTKNYEHSAPAFSPDGTVVLWTVVSKSYRASMMEMKYENGKWSSPH